MSNTNLYSWPMNSVVAGDVAKWLRLRGEHVSLSKAEDHGDNDQVTMNFTWRGDKMEVIDEIKYVVSNGGL